MKGESAEYGVFVNEKFLVMGESVMFCENCGNKIPDEAKFCPVCGATTGSAQPSYAAPEQPPVRPAAPAYVPPQPVSYAAQQANPPLSVGQYLGMYLLMCVPILNIVLLFMWAFGSAVNLNKKNYARAVLILFAVSVVIWIIFGGIFIGAMSNLMNDSYYSSSSWYY